MQHFVERSLSLDVEQSVHTCWRGSLNRDKTKGKLSELGFSR